MEPDPRSTAIQLLLGDESPEVIRRVISNAFPGMFMLLGRDPRDAAIRRELLSIRLAYKQITSALGGGSGLGALAVSNLAVESGVIGTALDRALRRLGLL